MVTNNMKGKEMTGENKRRQEMRAYGLSAAGTIGSMGAPYGASMVEGLVEDHIQLEELNRGLIRKNEVLQSRINNLAKVNGDWQNAFNQRSVLLGQKESMVEELEKEVEHWKFNHDNQVTRNKLLTDRPDVPLERVKAYEQVIELQNAFNIAYDRLADVLEGDDGQAHKEGRKALENLKKYLRRNDAPKELRPEDFEISTYSYTGGYNFDLRSAPTGVRVLHKPTGVTAFCHAHRSVHANKHVAFMEVKKRLEEHA